jgi:hypothetical protein
MRCRWRSRSCGHDDEAALAAVGMPLRSLRVVMGPPCNTPPPATLCSGQAPTLQVRGTLCNQDGVIPSTAHQSAPRS